MSVSAHLKRPLKLVGARDNIDSTFELGESVPRDKNSKYRFLQVKKTPWKKKKYERFTFQREEGVL